MTKVYGVWIHKELINDRILELKKLGYEIRL